MIHNKVAGFFTETSYKNTKVSKVLLIILNIKLYSKNNNLLNNEEDLDKW